MGARRDRPKPKNPLSELSKIVPALAEPDNPFSPTEPVSAAVAQRIKNRFIWSNQKRRAAQMLAQGDLLDIEIAAQLGVDRSTLARWRLHPTFLLGIKHFADGLTDALAEYGIKIKTKRLEDYDTINMLLDQIREERAAAACIAIEEDPDLARVGGFRTGLIVKQDRVIGTGSNAQKTTEYKIDDAWLTAKLALNKQVAQETGQWIHQANITGQVEHRMSVQDIRAAILGPQAQPVEGEYKELPPGGG